MAMMSFGRAVCLALLSVPLATCGDGSDRGSAAAVNAQVRKSDVEGRQARAFYEARGWVAAWDDEAAEMLQQAIANASPPILMMAVSLLLKMDRSATLR